jgi:hypothetical protein
MAYGIAKSLPGAKIETSSVRRAASAGISKSGGSAAAPVEKLISQHGEGTGNVVGQANQKEKG